MGTQNSHLVVSKEFEWTVAGGEETKETTGEECNKPQRMPALFINVPHISASKSFSKQGSGITSLLDRLMLES